MHVFVLDDTRREMAGPSDLKWRPGDHVRFGILEFLVSVQPESRGAMQCLFLIANRDISVELVEQYPWALEQYARRKRLRPPTVPPCRASPALPHLRSGRSMSGWCATSTTSWEPNPHVGKA